MKFLSEINCSLREKHMNTGRRVKGSNGYSTQKGMGEMTEGIPKGSRHRGRRTSLQLRVMAWLLGPLGDFPTA